MDGSLDQESREGLLQGWWDLEAPGAAESLLWWSEPRFSPPTAQCGCAQGDTDQAEG